jgi:hypothetical protein
MKVALFDGSTSKAKCVGMNVIDKCSPKELGRAYGSHIASSSLSI